MQNESNIHNENISIWFSSFKDLLFHFTMDFDSTIFIHDYGLI